MHARETAVKRAGTSALMQFVTFTGVQAGHVYFCFYVFVKMFSSDELCNFLKPVLGLPSRIWAPWRGHVSYSQEIRRSQWGLWRGQARGLWETMGELGPGNLSIGKTFWGK